MDRNTDINTEIERLKKELKNVQGTKCEVYSRIVGYHRPIDNWNEGKQAEYKNRRPFVVHDLSLTRNR